ncbi:MAG TPA: hypothetical protein PKH77_24545 [Anaerolineae bacterium]|nr:hypothetical protein [Anaerolineae bacterium]
MSSIKNKVIIKPAQHRLQRTRLRRRPAQGLRALQGVLLDGATPQAPRR